MLSISDKLADYEATRELLERLTVKELKQLAQRNGIILQKEDSRGNIRTLKQKSEIIDLLVASEFRESDLIELLGLPRLKKEELLNQMTTQQLRQLAKETGVLLEKSTLFGTKKATKKKDMIDVLKVLSTLKIRQHSKKIGLIKKATKKGKKRKATKPAPKKATKKASRKKAKKTEKAKEKRRQTRRTQRAALRAERPVVPRITVPSSTEGKGAVPMQMPVETQLRGKARMIQEEIRERIIEREIIRRQISIGISDEKLLKELRYAPLVSAKKETDYESQLSEWLSKRGIPIERAKPRKRDKFDLVLGKNDVAVELKKVRTVRAFDRLVGLIYRNKDRYRKIFVVLVDELQDPKTIRKEAERIKKMDPEKIKVIVKKAKKKK